MDIRDELKLRKALSFAALAHKNQVRKGTDIPYIIHPVETCLILREENADCGLCTAALLHDTLEDTDTKPEDIRERFGERVLSLVQGASEDKSKTWEERKSHCLEYLKNEADRDEKMLACADKLSNMRGLAIEKSEKGYVNWSKFKRGLDDQRWYYGGLLESLSSLSGLNMYKQLKELFEYVFAE